MKYLLGINFSNEASKATLIDTDGKIVAEHTVKYPMIYAEAGACEQDPKDWTRALCENTKKIIAKTNLNPRDILCISIDSATHTFLLCDDRFEPLGHAMHWRDARSYMESEYLRKEYSDLIFQQTFHYPDTIWTLPQLLWIQKNRPEIFAKAKYLFFKKDYIRYFLTDVFCTDYIEAEGSMLFDCNKKEWSDEICAIAQIDKSILPPIVNPTDTIGQVTEKASKETGLAEGTPVICGTTDTCMEMFASGAIEPQDITVNLATAGRICVITSKPYPNRDLVNYSHVVEGLWYPGTATKSCVTSYYWYQDVFGGKDKELYEKATDIPIGCEGMIFHPYLHGELTPYADSMLCGSFVGVRSIHTKAHFTRAVLEGVCYSLLDSKFVLEHLGIAHKNIATAIGFGAKGKLWLQMAADVLGIALKTTENSDPSLGSAMLAGVAVGVFINPFDAVQKCVRPKEVIMPNKKNTEKYRKVFGEYQKIHDALAPIYDAR